MKTTKRIIIAVISISIALAVFLVWFKFLREQPQSNTTVVNLYYRDKTTFEWEKEPRNIKNADMQAMVNSALSILKTAPESARLAASVPDFLDPITVDILPSDSSDNYIAELYFTDTYNAMTPLEASDCICSLVYTLTDFGFIDGVMLYVNGENLPFLNSSVLNRQNIITDIGIEIVYVKEKVSLYYADKSGNGLVKEEREIEYDTSEPLETSIIRSMIINPANDELISVIPKETKVISTKRVDVICYVDLNADFISKLESKAGGSITERLAIASIVNTLTERSGIKKVQILIEGSTLVTKNHGIDLTTPFERMESEIINE